MVATIQILVLLLAVIAAISVAANGLKVPPSILLVSVGVVLALIPGLPSGRPRARIRAPGARLPPIVYSVGGLDELARISVQPAPDRPARVRMRRFHDGRRRRRRKVRPVRALAGRLSARRDRVAPRRGRAARDRASAEASQAHPPRPRGGGPGQRRDRSHPLPVRRRGSEHRVHFLSARATLAFSAIVAGEIIWGIGVGWLMLRLRRWVR